jgi:hypothetical protein
VARLAVQREPKCRWRSSGRFASCRACAEAVPPSSQCTVLAVRGRLLLAGIGAGRMEFLARSCWRAATCALRRFHPRWDMTRAHWRSSHRLFWFHVPATQPRRGSRSPASSGALPAVRAPRAWYH